MDDFLRTLTILGAIVLAPILAIIIMFAGDLLTFDWFRKRKETKKPKKRRSK